MAGLDTLKKIAFCLLLTKEKRLFTAVSFTDSFIENYFVTNIHITLILKYGYFPQPA